MVIWRLRSPNSISIPLVSSFIGAMDLKLGKFEFIFFICLVVEVIFIFF